MSRVIPITPGTPSTEGETLHFIEQVTVNNTWQQLTIRQWWQHGLNNWHALTPPPTQLQNNMKINKRSWPQQTSQKSCCFLLIFALFFSFLHFFVFFCFFLFFLFFFVFFCFFLFFFVFFLVFFVFYLWSKTPQIQGPHSNWWLIQDLDISSSFNLSLWGTPCTCRLWWNLFSNIEIHCTWQRRWHEGLSFWNPFQCPN